MYERRAAAATRQRPTGTQPNSSASSTSTEALARTRSQASGADWISATPAVARPYWAPKPPGMNVTALRNSLFTTEVSPPK